MKSATKKLTAEISDTLVKKLDSISAGSKKLKKSIEKAAEKLAKKVSKFEKETLKKKAKEAKNALKKEKGKTSKEKAAKVASLVVAASKPVAPTPPVKAPLPSKPTTRVSPGAKKPSTSAPTEEPK